MQHWLMQGGTRQEKTSFLEWWKWPETDLDLPK